MHHRITAAALAVATMFGGLALASPAVAAPGQHPCHPHAEPTVIVGSLGNDRLVGTPCDNTLYGLAGNDVLLPRAGEDTAVAGRGNDRVRTVDGEADVVRCGAGFDRARIDQYDVTTRCEVVVAVSV